MSEGQPAGFQMPIWLRIDRRASASGLLLAIGLGLFGSYVVMERHYRGLTRLEVDRIGASEQVLAALKDVETGERGYVITGSDDYLVPYREALATIPDDLAVVVRTGNGARNLPDAVAAKAGGGGGDHSDAGRAWERSGPGDGAEGRRQGDDGPGAGAGTRHS